MADCLQLLLNKLRHLQHRLDINLRTDAFIHNKLIIACQDVPSCQYVCYKPAPTIAGLINDLRSLITTWEKSHSAKSSAFFIDHYYHQNRPKYGRSNSQQRGY